MLLNARRLHQADREDPVDLAGHRRRHAGTAFEKAVLDVSEDDSNPSAATCTTAWANIDRHRIPGVMD